MEIEKELIKFTKLIKEEITSYHPNWFNIIEYAKNARAYEVIKDNNQSSKMDELKVAVAKRRMGLE